jgi:para-nitrobenzyl esterase
MLIRKIIMIVFAVNLFSYGYSQTRVQVTGGQIEGILAAEGIRVFKGIPFAQPPTGDLRWKAPQPLKRWAGVKKTQSFGPAPIQSAGMASFVNVKSELSEDCLYLNVWTPAKQDNKNLPVMVWIHGGAFQFGATSQPVFDGSRLAEKGVVVVSIAYRLGIFGFFAHPELSKESGNGSCNYGLLDQIAGLKWINANVSAFGGDPHNVTIFGESAGGIAVSMLAASPKAKGLFHKAISQSGGSFAPTRFSKDGGELVLPLKMAESQGKQYLDSLGAINIASARKLPAGDLIKSNIQWWPVADNVVLPENPYKLYSQAKFNDCPILIGTNSDEGSPFISPGITPERFQGQMRGYGIFADTLLAVYPHATAAQAFKSAKDIFRESALAWPTWTWARLQSQYGKSKAFVYYFDMRLPGLTDGAYHSQDLSYVFGNFDNPARKPRPEDLKLSNLIQDYWVNFARTGDPNGNQLPRWDEFKYSDQVVMRLDATSGMQPIPNIEKLRAWDSYFAWRRKLAAQQKH